MIMQFFVEQREALAEHRLTAAEFQATTSATLVRIDRTFEYLLDRNHNNSPGCLG
jgi:hypothetical protein